MKMAEINANDKNHVKQKKQHPAKLNDADARFGTVEDAEKAVLEAFGIKPHKKPTSTSTVPNKTNATRKAPKKTIKTAIKDDDKIEKTFDQLDDSDKALEETKQAILKELNKISVNPLFNCNLIYYGLKLGAIYIQCRLKRTK